LISDRTRLARSLLLLSIAVFGLRRLGHLAWLIAALPIANGLLSFFMYRERNQLIGAAATAIALAAGLSRASTALPTMGRVRPRAAMAAFMLAAIIVRSAEARVNIRNRVDELTTGLDPCESSVRDHHHGDEFVTLVKQRYQLDDPHCEEHDEQARRDPGL
jgi:hypothetical protein